MNVDQKLIDAAQAALDELAWKDEGTGQYYPSVREDSPCTDQVEAIRTLIEAVRKDLGQ